MRSIPRGKYLDKRLRLFPKRLTITLDAPITVDMSDLGVVVDHSEPLPHPAIDQPQWAFGKMKAKSQAIIYTILADDKPGGGARGQRPRSPRTF